MLQRTAPRPATPSRPKVPLGQLIGEIVDRHHSFLAGSLRQIEGLILRLVETHGLGHCRLDQLAALFVALQEAACREMQRQERSIFPRMRQIDGTPGRSAEWMQQAAAAVAADHGCIVALLDDLRRLTNDFASSPDACPGFRVLLRSLGKLDADLRRHIDREHRVLFPRAGIPIPPQPAGGEGDAGSAPET